MPDIMWIFRSPAGGLIIKELFKNINWFLREGRMVSFILTKRI